MSETERLNSEFEPIANISTLIVTVLCSVSVCQRLSSGWLLLFFTDNCLMITWNSNLADLLVFSGVIIDLTSCEVMLVLILFIYLFIVFAFAMFYWGIYRLYVELFLALHSSRRQITPPCTHSYHWFTAVL